MECSVTRRLREQDRIKTTEEWFAEHRDHGDIREEDGGHPAGILRRLVCECGAKHLTLTKTTEAA